MYPKVNLSLLAQSKEAAAGLLADKVQEICQFYPMIEDCIKVIKKSNSDYEVIFKNGSRITNLASAQTSKGKRRHRIMIEESALLNQAVFDDAISPIANVPRICGTHGHNLHELNGQIHFLSTAYYKGAEFDRCLRMLDGMCELNGDFSIGSSWELGVLMGRGESKAQILKRKRNMPKLMFDCNYGSKWIGSSDNCILDLNKILPLRTLLAPELKGEPNEEYYIGMDVSRSGKDSNNQSSIVVIKVSRDKREMVRQVKLVNLLNLKNGMTFKEQAIILKRLKYLYNARMVVIDGNGLGSGIADALLEELQDPLNFKTYPAWKPVNDDVEPESNVYDECFYNLKAQGINSQIITNFISVFEDGKIQLLDKLESKDYDSTGDYMTNPKLAHIQTDMLIEEILNLRLIVKNAGKLAVEQISRSCDKDRFSSLSYVLYYLFTYENKPQKDVGFDVTQLLKSFRKPVYC